jgi:hypothetical protein
MTSDLKFSVRPGCRLAVMQPYLFPYLGYFQLVAGVDRFVFYDDVSYIKNGWINRNRLFLSGRVSWITFPVSHASANRRINEMHVQPGTTWRRKLLESVKHSYRQAPYFEETYKLLAKIVLSEESSLSRLAMESIMEVATYLGLETEFVNATGRYDNENLRGSERVIDICRQERAAEYHNLPGGTALYSAEDFRVNGVELRFVQLREIAYGQLEPPFKPGLSILDVLMFNDRASSLRMVTGHRDND